MYRVHYHTSSVLELLLFSGLGTRGGTGRDELHGFYSILYNISRKVVMLIKIIFLNITSAINSETSRGNYASDDYR